MDIPDQGDQKEIVPIEHNRAHREAQENAKPILNDYLFPKMFRLVTEVTSNWKICTMAIYIVIPSTTPAYAGEIIHIDIFSTDKTNFFTTIDKLS